MDSKIEISTGVYGVELIQTVLSNRQEVRHINSHKHNLRPSEVKIRTLR